jgi:hypothetical protein
MSLRQSFGSFLLFLIALSAPFVSTTFGQDVPSNDAVEPTKPAFTYDAPLIPMHVQQD